MQFITSSKVLSTLLVLVFSGFISLSAATSTTQVAPPHIVIDVFDLVGPTSNYCDVEELQLNRTDASDLKDNTSYYQIIEANGNVLYVEASVFEDIFGY